MSPSFAAIDPLLMVALIGVLLLPYVVVPVLVYFRTRYNGRPTIEEFYLEDPSLPRDVLHYVESVLEDLEDDGLSVLGAFFIGTVVARVRQFAVLAGKQSTKETALISVVFAGGGLGVRVKHTYVEFGISFGESDRVRTNNMQM